MRMISTNRRCAPLGGAVIVVACGKKGSGKSSLLRKLAARAVSQHRPIFYHDPQVQISTRAGRLYTSISQFCGDPHPPYLAIFRGMALDEVAGLALAVGSVTVVGDELDQACNNKKWVGDNVRRIVHEGRHYQVGLWGAFRRTANVSEDLLSQVDDAFLFRCSASSPADLQTIKQRFGEPYALRVQGLEDHQFVHWSDA